MKLQRLYLQRNEDFDLSLFKDLDEKRRNLLSEVEALKAKQNTTSKLIPQYKKEGKDVAPIMAEMKEISDKVKTLNADLSKAEEDLNNYMLTIPNIPHPSVPAGMTDEDNVEIRKFGEPTHFDFEPKGTLGFRCGFRNTVIRKQQLK